LEPVLGRVQSDNRDRHSSPHPETRRLGKGCGGRPSQYLRFTLSLRDVEALLAERGIIVTYETVRVWVGRFGPLIAKRLRRQRGRPSNVWHLDEMFVKIAGRTMYLWRAVDSEG
jgi:hypothetical protein